MTLHCIWQDEDGRWDIALKTLDVVNLTTGTVSTRPVLPGHGRNGCAVVHFGYIYWVRGQGDEGDATAEVYRAPGSRVGLTGIGVECTVLLYVLH